MHDSHRQPGELTALRQVCRNLARNPGQIPGAMAALGEPDLRRLFDPAAWQRIDRGADPQTYLFAPVDGDHLLIARVRLADGRIAEIGFDDLPESAPDPRPAAATPAHGRCPNTTLATALGAIADVLQTGDTQAIQTLRAAIDDRDPWSRMPSARDPDL